MKDGIRRHPLAAFLLLHGALVAAFLSPAILIGGIAVPAELLHKLYPWGAYMPGRTDHNAELTDVILQFYPWFTAWGESVRAGHWPLWNAHSGLGLPFAANPQAACYFPLTFLALLGPWAWTLVLASRLLVAGAVAFLWLRALGRSLPASTIGGLAYAYSLPFLTWLPWPHANVNMLLPLLLLFLVRLARTPGPRAAAGLGLTLFAMHLGGHPESAFLDVFAALFLWGLSLVHAPRARVGRSAAYLALGGALGTLAAAIQLVPFLEYLVKSRVLLERGAPVRILAKSWLVTWIAPLFFGRPLDGTTWPAHAGFLDSAAFAGASTLALAGVALATVRLRRTGAVLALGLVPAALAYDFPPASLVRALPLFDWTNTHRSLHLAALAVVTLGAFGWDRLRACVRARRGRLVRRLFAVPALLFVAAAAALFAFKGAVPGPLFSATAGKETAFAVVFLFAPLLLAIAPAGAGLRTAGVLALVTLDLWRVAFGTHGAVPRDLVFFPTRLTGTLRRLGGDARVVPLGRVMPPNLNLPYGIPSVMSYDAIDSQEQAVFLRKLGGYDARGFFSPVDARRLSNPRVAELASLAYWLDDPLSPRLDTPEFERRTGFRFALVQDQPDGRIYALAGVLPRVRFAGRATADPGLAAFDGLLDARDERAVRELFLDTASAPPGAGTPGRIAGVFRSSGAIEARVESDGPGFVFFGEGFDPGWRAEVDGRAAAVYRANGPFMAVPVPAGPSVVRVGYRPRSFALGAGLSVLGLAALAGLGLSGRARGARLRPRAARTG